MMGGKRTHKLRTLGDAVEIVAGASSVTAAAKALGVDRSTVTRWIADGKVPRPGGRRQSRGSAMSRTEPPKVLPVSADVWATDIKERYELSATESAIVELARAALVLALDLTQDPRVRAAGSREFRACVSDLNLEEESDGKVETPRGRVRAFPRPA